LNSTVFVTNSVSTGLQLMVTSNLTLLAAQSLTNDDAGILTLYPGLVIVPGTTIMSFTNVVTTNATAYYVNSPYGPPGTPPTLLWTTNYDTNVATIYKRQFANVVTNSYSTKSWVTVIDTNIYYPPNGSAGYFATNSTTTRMLTNAATGDFFINTNACGYQILSNILTKPIGFTNTVVVTNTPTNLFTGTYLVSRTYITWYTNHNLAYLPVQCVTNEPGLRRGIEKVTFVKTAYNSLLGASNTYTPQTNFFTMTVVTNSTNWVQTYQRVATVPDFLFTAQDMMPGPADPLDSGAQGRRSIAWNQANVPPLHAGPGIIDSPTTIIFNKSGPIFYNFATNHLYALDERTAFPYPMWASFDDSTNAPVLYPNGTSIASLESQMLMQVTSVSLPPGHRGTAYGTQLTGTGGSGPPYTWSLAPDSPAVPSGLVLTLDGWLSGTPSATGVYYFFVQMTGADGGFTVWQVTLTVLP